MVNIVIVAGGKQTRFNQLSVFPKVLLPSLESSSILGETIEKTENVGVKRFLVINKAFGEQVRTYLKVNGLQDKVQVIETTNTNGSFNSLGCIRSQLPKENLLFIWSDLTLSSFEAVLKTCESSKTSGIVFTYDGGKYRYKTTTIEDMFLKKPVLDKAVQVSDYSGNVPGIYFLRDLSLFSSWKEGCKENQKVLDLIDVVSEDASKRSYGVVGLDDLDTKLLEYRDLDLYKSLMLNSEKKVDDCQTRFFNQLTIDFEKKIATKKAIDPAYVHLIKKEIQWYSDYNSFNKKSRTKCIPEIYSSTEDSFQMEFLEGYKPLHTVLDEFERDCEVLKIKKLYANLFKAVDACGKISEKEVSYEVFKEDLKKEIVDKVIERCEKIKAFLISYKREELEKALQKTYNDLLSFAINSTDYDVEKAALKYGFCHGDLNGSNVLVNPETLEIRFVDPRGYFGNTKVYGWKPYETAKLLYCLYGYDDFNLKPQVYKSSWPQVRQSLEYSGFQELHSKMGDYKFYREMVAVIYIALAGYISQDIMKANIAYDYGMRLLEM